VLQAITIQEGRPVALISDRVLREGDEIDGVRIVRIGEAEVEVEADGVRTILRF
jgi:CRP-like cAMP-binding protein